MKQVEKLGEKGKASFIFIPPGSDRQHENQPGVNEHAPVIKY